MLNALTIDVEDYYHVTNLEHCLPRSQWDRLESRVVPNTLRLLDLLGEAGVRATFFVLGWVAERQRGLVRRIQADGHEIGSHGYAHQLIYHQTPPQFRADLARARHLLEDLTGSRICLYRAPSFSITSRSLWALDVLIDEGYLVDSSIYPIHHDRYGIPGTPLQPHRVERAGGSIWEFPPPVWRVLGYPLPVGGGGYLRLYPFALTRLGLRRINAQGRPFAVYLHPWEIDTQQPRLQAGWLRSIRHYAGVPRLERRLRRLLRGFTFGTISDVLGPRNQRKPAPVAAIASAA